MTVASVKWRRPAISEFESASATKRSISTSRSVSSPRSGGGFGGVRESAREAVEQAPGHGRGEQSIAASHDPDGFHELRGPDVLQHEPAGAGPKGGEHVLVQVVGGEHDDAGCGCPTR